MGHFWHADMLANFVIYTSEAWHCIAGVGERFNSAKPFHIHLDMQDDGVGGATLCSTDATLRISRLVHGPLEIGHWRTMHVSNSNPQRIANSSSAQTYPLTKQPSML